MIADAVGALPGASWITHPAWAGAEPPLAPPVIRTILSIGDDLVEARLAVAGLGVWRAHIGGRPVSGSVLEPGISLFDRRVAVIDHDVTDLLVRGPNALVVELGEGAAHVRALDGRYTKFVGRRVAPRLLAALAVEYADGRVQLCVTDGSWQSQLGPTTVSHWYGGEDYDARREPEGWLTEFGAGPDGWEPVAVLGSSWPGSGSGTGSESGPGSEDGPELWLRQSPAVTVAETLVPRRWSLPGGAVILDAGRNLAGWQHLSIAADVPAGTVIEFWPAEYLGADGGVDQTTCGAPIVDRFVAAGRTSRWRPRLTYHGFRFLEMRAFSPSGVPVDAAALAVDLTVERIMTDLRPVGSFAVSDPVLAGIYDLVTHAAESNLVSVPTDCPHREKLGWLEQDHLVFWPLAFRWDISGLFADLVTHICDAQTAAGLIPDIAPELVVFGSDDPGFRDDVNWGSAIWRVPHLLYRCYRDLDPARVALHAGRRYLDYLGDLAAGGLLDHGLSDWAAIDTSVPRALVATSGLCAMLHSAAVLEDLVGDSVRASRCAAERSRLLGVLRERYVARDSAGGLRLASGSQASIALLADSGALSAAECDEAHRLLVDRISRDGARVTVGEIALPALVRTLVRAGEHDVLYRIATTLDAPSYGRMLADGETALCEQWTGRSSNGSANHFMLGYISEWLTGSVAGLSQVDDGVGWQQARFAPTFLPTVDSASAEYHAGQGVFAIDWQRLGSGRVGVSMRVPAGAEGKFVPPRGYRAEGVAGPSILGPGSHRWVLHGGRRDESA